MTQQFFRSIISKRLGVAASLVMFSGVIQASEEVMENTAVASEEATVQETCFESREGLTTVEKRDTAKRPDGKPGEWMNVKCSKRTGGVLWWGDPFDGTIPMDKDGVMPVEADYSHEEAVVKPREKHIDRNRLLSICTTACHNGEYVPVPKDKKPRPLTMHKDIVPDSMNLQHGRGALWCLDCHNPKNRATLIDNFGEEVSFNQPQKLCGKCHGPIYRDWREGIHGKRIGMWAKGDKKRWWVCTECHNPHDVQQGARNAGFASLQPEKAPALPKGTTSTAHENHEHGDTPWWDGVWKGIFGGDDDAHH